MASTIAVAWVAAVSLWFFYRWFWVLAGLASAFLVVAPVLATGLYAFSRAREREEAADFRLLRLTWTAWGARRRSDPSSYWCLVRFGGLLGLAAAGWIMTSAAFVAAFSPAPVREPLEFVRLVLLSEQSWVFEVWLVLGGLMAAPIFASSVVTIPFLLDRQVRLKQAVLTSWQAVLANPVTMAVWASLLLLLVLVGFATATLGLIIMVPLLGHASWHAYRDLVDVEHLPERLPRHELERGGA
ncbi:MAG: DUF2189 domain-containing protein [Casimicrobiaceae bacterium]